MYALTFGPIHPERYRLVHARALGVYLAVVALHFAEHLVQLFQLYALGWSTREAGGLLGLWLPALNRSELLHTSFNSLQLLGLALLLGGFSGPARRWWTAALVAQSWHRLEHVLLQVQYLSGNFLFHAVKQTSLLELFFPRPELHFVYNLIVVLPLLVALALHRRSSSRSNSRANPRSSPSPGA